MKCRGVVVRIVYVGSEGGFTGAPGGMKMEKSAKQMGLQAEETPPVGCSRAHHTKGVYVACFLAEHNSAVLCVASTLLSCCFFPSHKEGDLLRSTSFLPCLPVG